MSTRRVIVTQKKKILVLVAITMRLLQCRTYLYNKMKIFEKYIEFYVEK